MTGRHKCITSSQVYRLMGTRASYTTYVNEIAAQVICDSPKVRTGSGRAGSWGTMCEKYAYLTHANQDRWRFQSDLFIINPAIPHHGGTPDMVADDAVADIKCFWQDKVTRLRLVMHQGGPHALREEFPDVYWQLLSNAMILRVNKAVLFSFIPSIIELDNIRDFAADLTGNEHKWVVYASDEELPHIGTDAIIDPVEEMEWVVDSGDLDALKENISAATKDIETIIKVMADTAWRMCRL